MNRTSPPNTTVHPGFKRTLTAMFLVFCVSAPSAFGAGSLIISEFRLRGPNGANDEFIEIYNDIGFDHTVSASIGAGYAIVASDGMVRCTIPNGTVIPNRGHYLCVNSVGYSLASYPAGNGTTATGDATYTTDIPDNAGIALFNNNTGGANFSLANRIDAVGSASEANSLYKEGVGYAALTPFSIDYSFIRDTCGKGGAVNDLTPCTLGGNPKDTDNNAADFYFVDTNGTSAGAGQRLGAPGPENFSSPTVGGSSVPGALLDSCASTTAPPNLVRDFTSDPANNSTFGTLDVRRSYTNNTGGNLTRLRFRIIDLSTFPAPSGFADLRPRTSSAVVVTVDRPPCGSGTSNVTVHGTTLEQPPSQPNGGGFNSSLGAGTVTLGTPLAAGQSIDLRFLFGLQQTGWFRIAVAVEGLTAGGDLFFMACHTENGCTDVSISKTLTTAGPYFAGKSLSYDLLIANSGAIPATNVQVTDTPSNLTITNVSGSGCAALPCTIPSLAAGASTSLTMTATIDAPGAFDNSATVTADETDSNLSNNADNTGNGGTAGAFDNAATVSAAEGDPDGAGNTDKTENIANAGAATMHPIPVLGPSAIDFLGLLIGAIGALRLKFRA